jgi:hypothetical protein
MRRTGRSSCGDRPCDWTARTQRAVRHALPQLVESLGFTLGWTVRYSARCPSKSPREWFANGSPCGAKHDGSGRSRGAVEARGFSCLLGPDSLAMSSNDGSPFLPQAFGVARTRSPCTSTRSMRWGAYVRPTSESQVSSARQASSTRSPGQPKPSTSPRARSLVHTTRASAASTAVCRARPSRYGNPRTPQRPLGRRSDSCSSSSDRDGAVDALA